jgi:hypothetical protein
MRTRPRSNTWQHELELLQKLSHPHIVKFLGYYEVDDYLFFVMEYAPTQIKRAVALTIAGKLTRVVPHRAHVTGTWRTVRSMRR